MRSADRDRGAYRQGLVLGLTMAEIMLLLVFCLLIAMAALMHEKSKELEAQQAELREKTLQAEGLNDVLERLGGPDALRKWADGLDAGLPSGATIDENWRRLVADAGLVNRLRQAGVDVEGLAEAATGGGVAPTGGVATAEAALAAERLARVAAERDAAQLKSELQRSEAAAAARTGRPTDLPPIITLREDRGFYFETGRAEPSTAFVSRIRGETTDRLLQLIADYDVDVIEVIGHTDERPMGRRGSNLDADLLAAVQGGAVGELTAADNAGLGLARAAEVARLLKSDPRLSGVEVLPMSAGQLIGTDGRLTVGGGGDERDRRRIEIRLRRSLALGQVAP